MRKPNIVVPYDTLLADRDRLAAELLTANRRLSQVILYHGAVVLDRIERTCHVAGQPRPLSESEFNLLAFLLVNRGQVWSAQELLYRVWHREPENPNQLNTVLVYVSYVNRRLGRRLIRTVRRLGYTIDSEDPNEKVR